MCLSREWEEKELSHIKPWNLPPPREDWKGKEGGDEVKKRHWKNTVLASWPCPFLLLLLLALLLLVLLVVAILIFNRPSQTNQKYPISGSIVAGTKDLSPSLEPITTPVITSTTPVITSATPVITSATSVTTSTTLESTSPTPEQTNTTQVEDRTVYYPVLPRAGSRLIP